MERRYNLIKGRVDKVKAVSSVCHTPWCFSLILILKMPTVTSEYREIGYTGLSWEDLCGIVLNQIIDVKRPSPQCYHHFQERDFCCVRVERKSQALSSVNVMHCGPAVPSGPDSAAHPPMSQVSAATLPGFLLSALLKAGLSKALLNTEGSVAVNANELHFKYQRLLNKENDFLFKKKSTEKSSWAQTIRQMNWLVWVHFSSLLSVDMMWLEALVSWYLDLPAMTNYNPELWAKRKISTTKFVLSGYFVIATEMKVGHTPFTISYPV